MAAPPAHPRVLVGIGGEAHRRPIRGSIPGRRGSEALPAALQRCQTESCCSACQRSHRRMLGVCFLTRDCLEDRALLSDGGTNEGTNRCSGGGKLRRGLSELPCDGCFESREHLGRHPERPRLTQRRSGSDALACCLACAGWTAANAEATSHAPISCGPPQAGVVAPAWFCASLAMTAPRSNRVADHSRPSAGLSKCCAPGSAVGRDASRRR